MYCSGNINRGTEFRSSVLSCRFVWYHTLETTVERKLRKFRCKKILKKQTDYWTKNLGSEWIRKEEPSLSLFKAAAEHVQGFGSNVCKTSYGAWLKSGRYCGKINTQVSVLPNKNNATLFSHNNCPHSTFYINNQNINIPKPQHESPVQLFGRYKKTIEWRERERETFFAASKEWQMERETEDIESAWNITKNKELWEECVCLYLRSCCCRPLLQGSVSQNRYAC